MIHAREDLMAQGLGSFDEWGTFFITVPGGLDRQSDWMPYDEAKKLTSFVKSRHPAHHREGLAVAKLNRPVGRVRRPGY
jgi:hypothetical protein